MSDSKEQHKPGTETEQRKTVSLEEVSDIILSLSEEDLVSLQIAILDSLPSAELWSYIAHYSRKEKQSKDAAYAEERALALGDNPDTVTVTLPQDIPIKEADGLFLSLSEGELGLLQMTILDKLSLAELWSYAAMHSRQNKQLDDALYAAERALALGGDNNAGKATLAGVYLDAGKYDEAIELYEQIDDPRLAISIQEGLYLCYQQTDNLAKAREAVDALIALEPDQEKHRERLEHMAVQQKDYKTLLEIETKRLNRPHYCVSGHSLSDFWNLCVVTMNRGTTSEELRHITNGITGERRQYVDILCKYYNRDYEGTLSQASAYLKKHGKSAPQKVIAQLWDIVATCHYENADYTKAREALENLIDKRNILPRYDFLGNQFSIRTLNLYGICLYREGNYEEAKKVEHQGTLQFPDEEIFYTNFIEACEQLGDPNDSEAVMTAGFTLAKLQTKRADREASPEITITIGGFETPVNTRELTAVLGANKPLKPALGRSKPKLPILIESSIDLKLTRDGQVKIIETNDMYMSGYAGFKRAYGKQMRKDLVIPHHRELEKILESKYGTEIEVRHPVSPSSPLPYIVQALARSQESVYTSARLPWKAVNERKDYLHLTTPKKWNHIFPRTLVVPRDETLSPGELDKRVLRLLHDGQELSDTNFVMKPCDDSIGRGVEVVAGDDIVSELHKVTSWSSPEGTYWHDHIYPNVLVQECIRSKPVQADNGKLYDGTMRIAFTAMLSPDGKKVENIKFYRPYWKLPSNPYDDSDTRNSVVSFPPSSLKKDEFKDRADEIPVSARVSFKDQWHVEDQLRPYLRDMLPRYALSAGQYAVQLKRFAKSGDDAKRALALDLSTVFTHAVGIDIIAGRNAAEKLTQTIKTAKWPDHTAAGRYRDYLFNEPVTTLSHAATLAFRAPAVIEKRLGLEPNAAPTSPKEIELKSKEWFERVEIKSIQPL